MIKTTISDIDIYITTALEKKVQDPVVLDIRALTSIADAFIILTGQSSRQVSSIAEHIRIELKKKGIQPISTDGEEKGHWVLLDYGHIIIHVFYGEIRSFYDLEGLWSDAKRIDISHMTGTIVEENAAATVEEIYID